MSNCELDIVDISVVVPIYCGEDYLVELVKEISELRTLWRDQHAPMVLSELILVDDGARDGSPAMIDKLAREHKWIVPLHLSRNYGQHPATIAGILYSSGRWVATLDEDLQHPPAKIPAFLELAATLSCDVVYALPRIPVHKNALRDYSSVWIKRLIGWLTGSPHVRLINSFRLIRGEIARSVASVAIYNTYFDIELGYFTQRITGISMDLVDQRFIQTGKSGYNFRSLLSHAWRMVFSSNLRALRFMTVLGALTVLFSFALGLGLIVTKLIWPDIITVRGWSSQMVGTIFFGGINIGMIGIALQYLSTLVLRAHGRPTFFVIDRSSDRKIADFFAQQKQ